MKKFFTVATLFIASVAFATGGTTSHQIDNINATGGATIAVPSVGTAFISDTATQTLSSKTLSAPALSGTITGTYTLGGTPTIPASAISSGQLSVGSGGTGLSTLTQNGILYGNAGSAAGVTSAGSQYQLLQAGSGGTPQFGALQLGQSAAVSGQLPYANGGTNASTQQGGMNNLAGAVTSGSYLRGNGTNVVMSTIQAGDIPSLSATYVPQTSVGANSGVASLDSSGKVLVTELPSVVMQYQGAWNPTTNTPLLSDKTQYTFTIASSSVTAGAVYTNNTQTFTVLSTIASSTTLVAEGTGAPLGSGTLTKSSGTGPGTIAFSAESAGAAPTNGNVYYVTALDASAVPGLGDASMTNFQIGDLIIYSTAVGAWQLVTPAAGVSSVNTAQGAVTVNAINQLSGDVTTSAASGSQSEAATIAASAVTLGKMANLAANSIIGNNTGSSATPVALTQTQLTAMVNAFSSSLSGAAPASGGGTANFLRADGTWTTPPGSSPNVNNTFASPQSVTAAGGITITGLSYVNLVFAQGNSGATTVTATPSITNCTAAGQTLSVFSTSATNTLTLQDNSVLSGSNLFMNGNWTGGLRSVINFICEASTGHWVEQSRQ